MNWRMKMMTAALVVAPTVAVAQSPVDLDAALEVKGIWNDNSNLTLDTDAARIEQIVLAVTPSLGVQAGLSVFNVHLNYGATFFNYAEEDAAGVIDNAPTLLHSLDSGIRFTGNNWLEAELHDQIDAAPVIYGAPTDEPLAVVQLNRAGGTLGLNYDISDVGSLRIAYLGDRTDFIEGDGYVTAPNYWTHGPEASFGRNITSGTRASAVYAFRVQDFDEVAASQAAPNGDLNSHLVYARLTHQASTLSGVEGRLGYQIQAPAEDPDLEENGLYALLNLRLSPSPFFTLGLAGTQALSSDVTGAAATVQEASLKATISPRDRVQLAATGAYGTLEFVAAENSFAYARGEFEASYAMPKWVRAGLGYSHHRFDPDDADLIRSVNRVFLAVTGEY